MVVTLLVSDYEYTDIEMLFDKEIQDMEINGRKLDKTGKKTKKNILTKIFFLIT